MMLWYMNFLTQIALETLSGHFDAVYDLTIAYKEKYENIVPRKRPKDLLG